MDKTTPSIEGYEPPAVWDIGELVDLTENKSGSSSDSYCPQPPDQSFS